MANATRVLFTRALGLRRAATATSTTADYFRGQPGARKAHPSMRLHWTATKGGTGWSMVVGALTTARSGLVSRSGGSQCGARGLSPSPCALDAPPLGVVEEPVEAPPRVVEAERRVVGDVRRRVELRGDGLEVRLGAAPPGAAARTRSGVVRSWRLAARSPSRIKRTLVRGTISATRDRRRRSRASSMAGRGRRRNHHRRTACRPRPARVHRRGPCRRFGFGGCHDLAAV